MDVIASDMLLAPHTGYFRCINTANDSYFINVHSHSATWIFAFRFH